MGSQGPGAVVQPAQAHLFFKGMKPGDHLVVSFYGSPQVPTDTTTRQNPWVCWKPLGGEQVGCWLNPFGDRGVLPDDATMHQLFTLVAMAIVAWKQGLAVAGLTLGNPLVFSDPSTMHPLTSVMALLGADVEDADDGLVERQVAALHTIILEVQELRPE